MKKLQDNTFALTFGLLAAHELDAVRCFEWRVLPITSFLPDNIGMFVFILAHVPLFGWLASICWSQNLTVRAKSRTLFAGFCCVHVGLHWLFRNDPNYAFEGWLSNGLIGGAGLAGALFLLLIWQRRQKQ
ncbi:MAG: DUF6713 family protein [Hyphomonadaceae bacterium]|jgi:hypothetical protein|nr:hypothetical protein [Aquidulcibacter sp.]